MSAPQNQLPKLLNLIEIKAEVLKSSPLGGAKKF